MSAAFAVVLEEFRDATLQNSVVLESVGRQVHGITGGQMREFAQRLLDAVPRPLSEDQILAWADNYFARTGGWPQVLSGEIADTDGDTWQNVHAALVHGLRQLPGNSSLAQFLAERRGVRNRAGLPVLTVEQILAWADSFHTRTGKWPGQDSGHIDEAPGETWKGISMAMIQGIRGLAKGQSLAQFLNQRRAVRNPSNPPQLSEIQILKWADAFYQRKNEWPAVQSGSIEDAPGESWSGVNAALSLGSRGLAGGSSLAKLLANERGKRNRKALPALTEETILAWADAFFEKNNAWPSDGSGPVDGVPGQTWKGVNVALGKGIRGLPGESSLSGVLEKYRNVRNRMNLSEITEDQILCWADAFFQRNAHWPRVNSGPIKEGGETWLSINLALSRGLRGLRGGSSLAQLLSDRRGVRNRMSLPPLVVEEIIRWINRYFEQTGNWPTRNSGGIQDCPNETWGAVDGSLKKGCRNLPGGSSLSLLVAEQAKKRKKESRD